jgi:uncharacterized membrane protein YedE/YeeE
MEVVRPLIGGVLIGTSATLLLTLNGRIAGISGIVGGLFSREREDDRAWRGAFLAGLLVGGVALALFAPSSLRVEYAPALPMAIVAGVLVGFGTQLGNGCTSGHGVCGISRLSVRSIVATLVFIATGALTVLMVKRS